MKITLDNLKKGNTRASYSGKHSKGLTDPSSKVKYKDMTTRSKTKLSQESVEIAEFQANNTDQRGKRSKLEFRGNHPHHWNPTTQFNSGYVADGGAFKGGRPGNKKGDKNDYAKAYGNTKLTTRPFAPNSVEKHVRLKVK